MSHQRRFGPVLASTHRRPVACKGRSTGRRRGGPGMQTAHPARPRTLRGATLLYGAGFLVHNGDHARRGIAVLTPQVMWAGTAGAVLSVIAVALVLAGHR